jgi:hypothetical protein
MPLLLTMPKTMHANEAHRPLAFARSRWDVVGRRRSGGRSLATSVKLHCHISRHCLIRIGFFLVDIKD